MWSSKNTLELLRRSVNYGWKRNLCQNLAFSIEMPACDNVIDESLSENQISDLLYEPDQITGLLMSHSVWTRP